jgi:4-diphosphocytidyl-2-C-methyl-D-erythritol kinase
MSARVLAPAKINLGLFVGSVREDGRHELVTVMQSVSLADELTLELAPDGGEDELICPGLPGAASENLAWQALEAFRAATGWSPGPLRLRVDKHVPVAAGLGGGSGDAAATLRLAAHASGLGDMRLLDELARALGADVPAQVLPGRWLARGAGEELAALPDPNEPLGVLVLPSAEGLSTAAVYTRFDSLARPREPGELSECARALQHALGEGQALPPAGLLENDLQAAASSLAPPVERALEQAVDAGADVALVSGSGPTVLGLFEGPQATVRARRAAESLTRLPAALACASVASDFARPAGGLLRNN